MKRTHSPLLGLAALATLGIALPADAGEVAFGGYYRFQVMGEDANVIDENSGSDEFRAMRHELEIRMDMKVSPKTHAHLVMRPIDSDTVEGMGSSFMESAVGTNAVSGRVDSAHEGSGATATDEDGLDIRQLWLETEAWGIGVKVGEMPISLNDAILLNDDGDSAFGGVLLSKTLANGVTAVLGTVRVDENNTTGRSITGNLSRGADDDDVDLYLLSLLGPFNGIQYNFTLAHLSGNKDAVVANTPLSVATTTGQGRTSDTWAALTLNGAVNGVNWVGTAIYERGYSHMSLNTGLAQVDQMEGGGVMLALRLNGKLSWGEWNAYGYWGGENFDSLSNRPNWSMLYDSHGSDLMHNFLQSSYLNSVGALDPVAPVANDSGENAYGLGVGLKFKAGIWEVIPQLDYVSVNQEDYNTATVNARSYVKDAWGGTLKASTPLDKDTTFSLIGAYLDVNDNDNLLSTARDNMHTLLAEVRINY